MKLNCDLGEGFDSVDAQVMPHLDMANIACGGHAGNEQSMIRCIALAQNYGVAIGAHPSYPDRDNLGRKSIAISDRALHDSLLVQISTLQELCEQQGARLGYVKPHGALYNDMVSNPARLETVVALCSGNFPGLPLIVQSLPNHSAQQEIASRHGQKLWFEGFADRAYCDNGSLVKRTQGHAVHQDVEKIAAQAMTLVQQGGVFSETGQWLPLQVDTLCVHGDTPTAVQALLAIRRQLDGQT